MGGVDLHCHILPAIDDGADDLSMSKELLQMSLHQGIDRFVFTPHFYPERMSLETFLKCRERAVRKITPAAKAFGVEFKVGAEIQFTPVLANLPLENLAFSGTQYLLLELLTAYKPYGVEGLIKRICDAGYVPILAHVERFPYIRKDPELLYRWISAGALGQINASWVLHDRSASKWVERYFKWNLIHVMASDTHSPDRRPPLLGEAQKALPPEMADEFKRNAELIFENKPLEKKPTVKPVKRFGRWR